MKYLNEYDVDEQLLHNGKTIPYCLKGNLVHLFREISAILFLLSLPFRMLWHLFLMDYKNMQPLIRCGQKNYDKDYSNNYKTEFVLKESDYIALHDETHEMKFVEYPQMNDEPLDLFELYYAVLQNDIGFENCPSREVLKRRIQKKFQNQNFHI